MDLRPILPGYAVAPQIVPADMAEIAAAGYRTVIDNRPDHEIPPELHAAEMRTAAAAAGLVFVEVPADGRAMTADTVAAHARAMAESDGPVLAYCASGTRSTILWALSQAGRMGTDAIIDAAAQAGYALEPFREQIEAARRG